MAQKYFGLQWHITDSCDQRCKHCYIYAGKDLCKNNDLPFEKLSVILQDFIITSKKMKRTPFISVTGGDPLLYKNVWDFLELLKQNNIKFAILGNPFHITDEVAMKLKDYGCINYQMSLDGLEATHDFIRKKGSFTATLSKLNCLRKAGIATTIMATVSKSNIDEIPNLVDTVVKYEVDNFAFARYCPNPDDFQNIVSAEEYHEFLGTMWEKFISYKDSHTKFVLKDHLWTLFLYENGLFNIDNVENPKDLILDGCRCGISHMTVLSDGTVYACRRCESPIGKVPEESLYDIFFGEKMKQYRQYEKFEECSKCKLKNFCRGCPSVAKCLSGNFYGKDPQCWKTIQ